MSSTHQPLHVVLIHGQGRTPLAMLPLGWRLRRAGYQVHYFWYVVALESCPRIERRFQEAIRQKIGDRPYAIVSHSLGGIISRASLPALAANPPRRLVMLAPPNQPSQLARRMWRLNPLYRWLTGDCGRQLASPAFYDQLPQPAMPVTVIAGTRGLWSPLSPFEPDEPNDAILTVAETRPDVPHDLRTVPAWHPFIMFSTEVAEIVEEVLGRTV